MNRFLVALFLGLGTAVALLVLMLSNRPAGTVTTGDSSSNDTTDSGAAEPETAEPSAELASPNRATSPEPTSAPNEAVGEQPELRSEAAAEPERRPADSPGAGQPPSLQANDRDGRVDESDGAERDDPSGDPPNQQERFVQGIRDGFAEGTPGFVGCYEMVLEARDVEVDQLIFEILATTSLDEPEFAELSLQSISAGELQLEELECFADVIETLSFPAPPPGEDGEEGAVTIRYPVALRSE